MAGSGEAEQEAGGSSGAGMKFTRSMVPLGGVAVGDYTAEAAQIAWREIVERLEKTGQRPVIDRVLPLSKAAEAHRLQEENTLHKAGTLAGKIVLKP